jgi:glucose-1-phosphate cytidylyltransferase
MKAVILAGGAGTRLMEETVTVPKPMVEIGGKPIIWHIMKIYSHYGVDEFVILTGYKGYLVKEYFANYRLHHSDVTFDMKTGEKSVHANLSDPWRVTIVDTGPDTMTGGRILRAKRYIGEERFFLTYGDGLSDIDLDRLLELHLEKKATVTMTAVRSDSRFGYPSIDDKELVTAFTEKPENAEEWINGGFFVVEPDIFDYLNEGDATIFERHPLETLAVQGRLAAYRHAGFWKCMDTLRDKIALNEIWRSGTAPWKLWRDNGL